MKLFKYLIATLLLANVAIAQTGVINVVRNDSAATVIQSNNLANSKISTDNKGVAYVQFSTAQSVAVTSVIPGTGATNLGKAEDQAAVSADVGVASLYVARDPLTASTVSATNDYINPVADLAGRAIVTFAPYGETWQSCSSAATGTGDTAIKALVASNRIYTTQISCSNTSAVPSQINIKDGSTIIAVGSIGAQTTGGAWGSIYTVPLRGTAGTALNFAMVTTSTSTTCCAVGYISVN